MFRLTREVRFAVNDPGENGLDEQFGRKPSNSFGGYPSLTGFGFQLAARVQLAGALQPDSQYLVNIKEVDEVIRHRLDEVSRMVHATGSDPVAVLLFLHGACHDHWQERFDSVSLLLSPFLEISARRAELPMVRLSQRFEFSASHRLFNRELSDDENCRIYGKCSNPHGHGHNYELQVTVAGERDGVHGVLIGLPAFERIVGAAVIDRFDHKNLNLEVSEFAELIPSVENIARVIYKLLQPRFGDAGIRLAGVTVWETPKTWCEYAE